MTESESDTRLETEEGRHDRDDLRDFRRGILVLGGACILLFAGELALELYRLGIPTMHEVSWAGSNNTKLVDSLSPIARAYNNVLAMLLATVGLAIPLTANMHTPKLIDLFLSDRVNRVVLTLMALGAANVLFVIYLVGPGFAPMWAYRFAIVGALAGWVVLIPYFFYVVRFLDPSTIVQRLRDQAVDILEQQSRGERDSESSQDELRDRLFQLGTLVMKSIDRGDRPVAREGIWALRKLARSYGEIKDRMPPEWFSVGPEDFVGSSRYAREMMTEKHTWVETQVLQQLLLCYQTALHKAPDTVSALVNVNRKIALDAHERGDVHVVSQCIRLCNTFLREALNRHDERAAFDIFYQYRQLAADLRYDAEITRRIGSFFVTYADLALAHGVLFVWKLAAFDLEKVMEKSFKADNESAEDLFQMLLSLSNRHQGEVAPSRVRAKLIAAGFFGERGMTEHVERIGANLAELPPATVRAEGDYLVSLEKQAFWEITDRAINIEWSKAERRAQIAKFVERYPAAA